jgi:hypothetical protein
MPAIQNYFYRIFQQSPGVWKKRQWSTVTRSATEQTVSTSSAFALPNNTIVDVYQKSPGTVVIVSYMGSAIAGNLGLNLSETVIRGGGGDTNNTLLFQRYEPGVTFEFAIYSHVTKEVTLFTYPVAQVWYTYILFPNVEYIDQVEVDFLLQQYCLGTTLRRVYYDGSEDSSPPGDLIRIEDTPNSTICGYVEPVPEVIVTEVKRVKIDHACYDNPVYLVWKNTLGGWDQWLFQKTQTNNLDTESLGSFEEPEYDLETSEGASNSLGSNAGESLILGADNLTTNQYNAIRDLLYSPMIYQVEKDSSKKKVLIMPGSFSMETKDRLHSIEFEISLPKINTVRS